MSFIRDIAKNPRIRLVQSIVDYARRTNTETPYFEGIEYQGKSATISRNLIYLAAGYYYSKTETHRRFEEVLKEKATEKNKKILRNLNGQIRKALRYNVF